MTINIWAIIVSMVSSVIIGFAWYGPLFGKPWMAMTGIKMPEQKPSFSVMIKPMLLSLVGAFFMSFVLARMISIGETYLGFSGASNGFATAIMAWLGFVVAPTLAPTAWEGKPWKLWMIHAGYWLVLLLVMGGIIGAWK